MSGPMKERARWAAGVAACAAGLACAAWISVANAASAEQDNAGQGVPPEVAAAMAAKAGAPGADKKDKPDFPPFDEASKDYTKVVSTADGAASMYTLYKRDKDSQMLAELPKDFEKQRLFIALTIAGGEATAGIQFGDMYAYWKRYDKRLALIEPNVAIRSSGDFESQKSRENLFTDRVILDVPIVCMGPGGGPVIDVDDLLVGQAAKFFGPMVAARGPDGLKKDLALIEKAKAFPQNVEIAYNLPIPSDNGRLMTLHYSWSVLPENTGYKPREADPRAGYFTTSYFELGKPGNEEPWVRYVNRWRLEKQDESLKLSPPKQPIVFYVEHTTPVRYRRWVREGAADWNKAFEKVGILNAIEVYQQDARSGAHMDKDPEDVRYNFLRWNTNGAAFAIGPSRVDPRTGQILDADIVMNDGFIRSYARQWSHIIPAVATEGMSPQTLAWLETKPDWDPRVLLASPAERERIVRERAAQRMREHTLGADAPGKSDERTLMGASQFDGLGNVRSQVNGFCALGEFQAMDVALGRLMFDSFLFDAADEPATGGGKADGADDKKDKDAKEEKPKDDELDGLPEQFIGPIIKEVMCHEVGHTLGLRHNFKASTIRTIQEINSAGFKGKPQVGSVMDYNPVNINCGDGDVQGDWVTPDIGPYDYWVIEAGYCADKDLKTVMARSTDPDHCYGTDEDAWGPDPLVRRYDYGKNPLDFCDSRMRLVKDLRSKILDRAVKDGQGWKRAREAYDILLGQHMNAVAVASRFVGGTYLNRDRKGDTLKDGTTRDPIENVPVDAQRRALKFVIESAFRDEAFGLTPELLVKMTQDKWWDEGGMRTIFDDPMYPVHDRIAGIQRTTMTMLLNPATLTRIYDNEFRVPSSQDAVTLAEVLSAVTDASWSELDGKGSGGSSVRQPTISSLRRTLQRSNLERLIDLSMPGGTSDGPAGQAIATLATAKLRELHAKIAKMVSADGKANGVDAYTGAHLADARTRIEKALDATYIYNADKIGGGTIYFMGQGQPAGATR